MKKDTIGWRFPPTNGGRIDGFKDPGIGYFTGQPLSSLARETIQNSLDARRSAQQPVHVSFELVSLKPDDFGRDELAEAIEACRQETTNDATARAELEIIADMCAKPEIPCLRVSDRNTTGLQGEHWRALVKMQGVSHKAEVVGRGWFPRDREIRPVFGIDVADGVLLDVLYAGRARCRAVPRQIGPRLAPGT